jgi:hypothetical protein
MEIGTAHRGGTPRPVLDQHLGHQITESGRVVGPARREVEALEAAAPRFSRRGASPES